MLVLDDAAPPINIGFGKLRCLMETMPVRGIATFGGSEGAKVRLQTALEGSRPAPFLAREKRLT